MTQDGFDTYEYCDFTSHVTAFIRKIVYPKVHLSDNAVLTMYMIDERVMSVRDVYKRSLAELFHSVCNNYKYVAKATRGTMSFMGVLKFLIKADMANTDLINRFKGVLERDMKDKPIREQYEYPAERIRRHYRLRRPIG